MASTSDENSFDDTASSLGDSSYDFLDDRSAVTTDDEGSANLTLSFSSSDGPESETPIVSQSQNTDILRGPIGTSQISDHGEAEDTTDEDQGSHILKGEDPGIRFDEAPSVGDHPLRFFEVSHTIKEYENHEIQGLLDCGSFESVPTHLKLTVRQTMAGQKYVPDGPFRILFIGDPGVKERIVQKFGSILAAFPTSPEKASSRFNVIPISSFGQTRSPEVLLVDSVGLEISVKDCVSASFSRKEGGNDSICLTLSDNTLITSTWSSLDSRFEISAGPGEWQLPQIAVFYLSNTDAMAAKHTRRFARSFMSRHRIPCLMIAQTQVQARTAEAVTLDYLTPHLCFETSIDQARSSHVIKRFPVDMSIFLELDAAQLNRNLACLMELSRGFGVAEKGPNQAGSVTRISAANAGIKKEQTDVLKPTLWQGIKQEVHRHALANQALLIGSLLLVILLPSLITRIFQGSSTFLPGGISQDNLGNPSRPVGSSIRTAEPVRLSVQSALTTATAAAASMQSKASQIEPTISPNTDLAAFLLDSHALTPNNSAKFKVHVVGDCHIVLRPPHWFMRYRKAPKLVFSVTRQNAAVGHELSMLFDGVYALKVVREEAYGTVNVSIRTTSKPKINESFQVDFGNTWLKAAGWKKAAHAVTESLREDLDLVHNGLSTLYSHATSEVQVFVQDAVKKVDIVRKEMDRLRQVSINHTVRSTDLVLAQTKDITLRVAAQARNSTSAVSKQVVLYDRHLRKDLALYYESKRAAVKSKAQTLSQSVKTSGIRKLGQTTDRLKEGHLRMAQKEALKAWWKVAGPPTQMPADVPPQYQARKRRLCSTKRNSR